MASIGDRARTDAAAEVGQAVLASSDAGFAAYAGPGVTAGEPFASGSGTACPTWGSPLTRLRSHLQHPTREELTLTTHTL